MRKIIIIFLLMQLFFSCVSAIALTTTCPSVGGENGLQKAIDRKTITAPGYNYVEAINNLDVRQVDMSKDDIALIETDIVIADPAKDLGGRVFCIYVDRTLNNGGFSILSNAAVKPDPDVKKPETLPRCSAYNGWQWCAANERTFIACVAPAGGGHGICRFAVME